MKTNPDATPKPAPASAGAAPVSVVVQTTTRTIVAGKWVFIETKEGK